MKNAPEAERYEAYVGRLARGAGISSFGQVIGRVLNYALQVALARMFGPAQLGFYVLGFTIAQIADVLAQFGMSHGVVRYVAQHRAENDIRRVRGTILLSLWATLAFSVVLASFVFFGAGFLAEGIFHEPKLVGVIRVFSISVPFFSLMSMALWATQGFQTVKYDNYVHQIQQPLANLVLAVVFYLLGVQIVGAVVAYVLSMVIGLALSFYYLKRVFPQLLDRTITPEFAPRAFFGVSAPMIVANFTQKANSWTAITVLGAFSTAQSVGVFNAAFRTAALSGIVLTVFKVFTPMVSSLYRTGRLEDLRNLYQDVSRWTLTGAFAVFLVTVLLAKDLMAIFGPQFVSAWVVVVVIAAAQLYNSSVGHTNRILAMTGNQNVVMVATITSTIAGVVATIVLVPEYGALGAGVGVAAGIVVWNTISLLAVRRRLGMWPYNRGTLKPLSAGLVAVTLCYVIRLVLSISVGIPAILVLAPAFMVLYLGLLLAFGLGRSDKQLLAALWEATRRVLKRAPRRASKDGERP